MFCLNPAESKPRIELVKLSEKFEERVVFRKSDFPYACLLIVAFAGKKYGSHESIIARHFPHYYAKSSGILPRCRADTACLRNEFVPYLHMLVSALPRACRQRP